MRERWKAIPGFDGYAVSSIGRVRSYWRRVGQLGATLDTWRWAITTTPKLLAIGTNWKGYHVAFLRPNEGKRKTVSVHLLMLTAFVGPRPRGLHGCHIDDDKVNNVLANLAWDTKERNLQSRFANHGGPKLSKKQANRIKRLRGTRSQAAIARQFGVSQSHISRIHSGGAWFYV